jgi:hypothetical protein
MPSWHCSATSKIHTLAAAPLYEKEPASAASRRRQKRRGHSGPGANFSSGRAIGLIFR